MGSPNVQPTPNVTANDVEIEQIMSEIDKMQQEMEAVAASSPAEGSLQPPGSISQPSAAKLSIVPPQTQVLTEFREGASPDASLEDTLSELKDEGPIGSGVLFEEPADSALEETVLEEVKEESVPEKLAHTRPAASARKWNRSAPEGGSLSLNLKGNMTLDLCYECEGQQVSISFIEGVLHLDLADGTELRIPLRARGTRS